MNTLRLFPLLALSILCNANLFAAGNIVTLEKMDDGYQLLRNGEPYYIKGAGTNSHLEELVASGGNSIRTWSADGVGTLLDDAHALGLTVTVGFWLGHERHGFRYNNPDMVQQQFEKCQAAVRRYKDHPAVLMWAIGNEMEIDLFFW